jgi:prophage antirepressor-like protein
MFMMPQIIIHGIPFKGKQDMSDRFTDQYWAAKELCQILKIKNIDRAIAKIDPDDKWEIFSKSDKAESDEMVSQVFVNHHGLCALILMSESPLAVKFKRWITNLVLPAVIDEGKMIPIEPTLKNELEDFGLLPY